MKEQMPMILSALALATAVAAIVRSGPNTATDPQVSNTTSLAPLSSSPQADSAQEPSHPTSRDTVRPSNRENGTTALLIDMQRQLQEMEMTLSGMRVGWHQLARRGLVPLSESDILLYQQQAANPALSAEERLSALSMLRRHNGINDQVAMAMAQMAQTTTDPRLREQIFGQMDGLTNAALQGVLLTAVSQAQEADVRRRAADALSGFSSDPTVQSWLRHLQENDPDEGVRREARQALNERLQRLEASDLQQVVLASDVSTSEKLAAMERLRREDARSPEVVAAMVGLSQTSEDPNIKAMIFSQLDGLSDPILRDPLLAGLASEENARVRAEAADALSAFRSDPDVVAWLQHVAENDPDPRVKREALASLQGEELRNDRRGPPGGRGGRGGR